MVTREAELMRIKPYSKLDASVLKGADFGVCTTFLIVNEEAAYKTTDTWGNETTDTLEAGQYYLRIKKIVNADDSIPTTGAVSLIWEEIINSNG